MSINSLAIAKRLQAAERENRTAEEIALALQEIQDASLEHVATKEFVAAVNDRIRTEIDAKLQRLKGELTVRMGAMLAAAVAALGSLKIFS